MLYLCGTAVLSLMLHIFGLDSGFCPCDDTRNLFLGDDHDPAVRIVAWILAVKINDASLCVQSDSFWEFVILAYRYITDEYLCNIYLDQFHIRSP